MTKQRADISRGQLCQLYLKLGAQAYGGWSTTYLLVEQELSKKRGLLSEEQLQTAMAAGQALPGPAQVIVAAQTSYFLKGVFGSVLATFCYLLPSLVLTLIFCFIYFHYFAKTNIGSYTIGVQAAVGGIIIGNGYKIARRYIRTPILWLVSVVAGILYYLGYVPTLGIIFGFGIAGVIVFLIKSQAIHG